MYPSPVCANTLDTRSTGNYDRLVEKLEGGYCAVFVVEKEDFVPPCRRIRKLARVAVAVQCLERNGPYEITKNEWKGAPALCVSFLGCTC